jgi:hypothetical protein
MMTLLFVSTLWCRSDDTYDEERAIENLFCCVLKKYK